jgi:branched-chain amino acid aminotransferase
MESNDQIYVNGKWLPSSEACISVFDHGFLYGDGVFEGIRVYKGRIFLVEQHVQRLRNSAKAIQLDMRFTNEELIDLLQEACTRNNIVDGYIRLVVSRGIGDLGLDPRKCPNPSLVIIASTISLYPEALKREGIKMITASVRRIGSDQIDPQIKSLNYLNNILARQEANRAGCHEALLLNSRGFVSECTVDNIFIVKTGVIYTPPLDAGILKGITRGAVIDLVHDLSIPLQERHFARFDVANSDEAFITGTASEIVPVVEIDGQPIGTGCVGPITTSLMEAFQRLISA